MMLEREEIYLYQYCVYST